MVAERVRYSVVFDTEPRWASGAVFGPRMQGEEEGPLRHVVEFTIQNASSGTLMENMPTNLSKPISSL
jgi:hypothetical protein